MRRLALSWLPRAVLMFLPACQGDGGANACHGGECVCRDIEACGFDCAQPGCRVNCERSSSCGGRCVDDCAFTCRDASSCHLVCGNQCMMTCSRASRCDIDCLDGCHVLCSDVSSCRVRLRGGWVLCERTGDCDVSCVRPGGASTPAHDCGGGRFACGPC